MKVIMKTLHATLLALTFLVATTLQSTPKNSNEEIKPNGADQSAPSFTGPDKWSGVKPGATFCPFPDQVPNVNFDNSAKKWKPVPSFTKQYTNFFNKKDPRDRWQIQLEGVVMNVLRANVDAIGNHQLHIRTFSGISNVAVALKVEYPTKDPKVFIPHIIVLFPDMKGCITTTSSSQPGDYPINISIQIIHLPKSGRRRKRQHLKTSLKAQSFH